MLKILISIILISIALDMYYVYLIVFPIVVLYKNEKRMLNYDSLILLVLVILFVLSFLFYPERLFLPTPFITILKYIVIIGILFYMSFFLSNEDSKYAFKVFCIAMISNGLIIIYYSYFLFLTTDSYYGYGRLFNPIHSVETISPKIALSIISPLIVYCLIVKNSKITSFFFLGLSLYAFIYIQSRAAILLSLIVLSFYTIGFFKELKKKNKIRVVFLILPLVIFGTFYYTFDVTEIKQSDSRLINAGLESKRFLHWKDGVNKLIEHPFGGFTIDKNIENVNYFHNIIIDSARIYGWLAVFFIMLIYFMQQMIISKNKGSSRELFLIFLLLNLVMLQDVVIEGNFLLFALSIYISFLSTKKDIFSDQ